MTLPEIQHLVRQGETETVEFKTKANHPEKIVKEMVAFANTKGGKLLVGVTDHGRITGLPTANEELYILEKAINKYCFPKFDYQHEIIPVSAKKAIIIYTIFESNLKPHYALLEQPKNQRKGYIRVADRSVQASREMREILRRERNKTAVRFTYGEKEKVLMNYLEKHQFITIKIFSKLAGIKPYLASRTLITLVLAKVLQIIPREGEDWYRFNTISV
jgi:predicted HTH transcriptional regulator